MPPIIASGIFTLGILGLFYLDRGKGGLASKALWIPAVWLFLASSRPVSAWFGVAPSSANAAQAYVDGSPIDRAVYTLLVVAALTVAFARRDRVAPLLLRNKAIVLFFLFCGLSILWSDFPVVAFKRYIKALGDVAVILIVLTEAEPVESLKRVLIRLGFILFPLSVLFIRYYPSLGEAVTQDWTMEAIGVAQQKNSLGGICFIYGLVFIWCFDSLYCQRGNPSRARRLLAYGSILAMIIWLLHQCNSMTSITGLAMAGSVMLLSRRLSSSGKRTWVHLLVISVITGCIFSLFLDPASGLISALGRNPNLTGRTVIWHLVLSLHTNPWIGTGFESFWLGQRLEEMSAAMPNFIPNEAHNGYLEVYLNLGWVGLTTLALLLATGYRRVIATLHKDPQTGALFLAFFLATIIESFTEAAFRMMGLTWMLLLLVTAAYPAMCLRGARTPTQARSAVGHGSGDRRTVPAIAS